jgi:PTS system nitrogen regulatory IIA component
MQLNVVDAATILNVPQSTLLRWINEDNLPAKEVNGQYHFSPSELLEWATAHGVSVRADRFPGSGVETDSLVEAIIAGGVWYELAGGDKPSVLRNVVDSMPLGNGADRELLLELFLAREAVGSTAVGDGIAIPHPRHPLILPVNRPLLSVCFLAQPIDFGSKLPEHVHTLLVLICPTIQTHLRLLARVAHLLNQESTRSLLKRRAVAEEIVNSVRQLERSLNRRETTATSESA